MIPLHYERRQALGKIHFLVSLVKGASDLPVFNVRFDKPALPTLSQASWPPDILSIQISRYPVFPGTGPGYILCEPEVDYPRVVPGNTGYLDIRVLGM